MDRRDLEEMVARALDLMVVKALAAAMATTSARAAMISARAAMTSARAVVQRKALMDFLASRRRAARACVQARAANRLFCRLPGCSGKKGDVSAPPLFSLHYRGARAS